MVFKGNLQSTPPTLKNNLKKLPSNYVDILVVIDSCLRKKTFIKF